MENNLKKPDPIIWGSPSTDVSPRRPTSTSTPAQKLLASVASWDDVTVMEPRSKSAEEMLRERYWPFLIESRDDVIKHLTLGETDTDVLEIHTIMAHPVRCGHGSQLLGRLCIVAHELNVRLWLNAIPYGSDRMPLNKLKAWYRRFGFIDAEAERGWVNITHQRDGVRFDAVMTRNPVGRLEQSRSEGVSNVNKEIWITYPDAHNLHRRIHDLLPKHRYHLIQVDMNDPGTLHSMIRFQESDDHGSFILDLMDLMKSVGFVHAPWPDSCPEPHSWTSKTVFIPEAGEVNYDPEQPDRPIGM